MPPSSLPSSLGIAICLSHFHPTIGGAERQMLQLARCFAARGHRPIVFTRRVSRLPAREMLDGIEIRRVIRTLEIGPAFGASYLASLVAGLARHAGKYHVLLAGQTRWEAVATGIVSRLLTKPAVARVASIGPQGDLAQLGSARGTRFWRWAVVQNSCFLAPSAQAHAELVALGCPPERIRPVTNGVDLFRFQPRPVGHPTTPVTVLFVGRLAPEKNPELALAAWRYVAPGQARLLFAGEGPLRQHLQDMVRSWGLAGVEFLGQQQDMPTVYGQADILLQTSPFEGCSNALLEGMAAGLCPLATRVPGNQEVVRDGETGLLVSGDDPRGLAAAIGRLATDSALRLALAQNARRAVESRHNLEYLAVDYLTLFEQLWRQRRG